MRPVPPVDVGEGRIVVLLHGFLGCAEDFQPMASRLSARRRAIALDLPGHGPEPPPVAGRGNSFFAAVDDVVGRIGALGIERFDLVGYSMGGRIAFGILSRHPARVRRSVLIGASPGIEDGRLRRARREADARLAERLEHDPLDSFVEWWYGQRLFGTLKQHVSYPLLAARRLESHASELAHALVAMSAGVQPPLQEDLERSEVPMMLIAGEGDSKYAGIATACAARFPTAEAFVVPGAAHAVHVEQSGAVFDAVERFVCGDVTAT